MLSRALTLLCVIGYAVFVMPVAWDKVRTSRDARDYATYHYAVQVAAAGGDPYETGALSAAAREERTRGQVHPYFYPPPFLVGMWWARGLDLATSYRAFFWLNQAMLAGVLAAMWRWFRAPGPLIGLLLLTFSPIPDNAWMGQANLPVLLVSVLAMWRVSGAGVAAGGMAKMSPALYLVLWTARGWWRPVLVAAAGAVGLSLMAVPFVGWEPQVRFYTEILPSFSGGPYHDLTVPMTLPANHSIPDLWNQLWPGDGFALTPPAKIASQIAVAAGLIGLCAASLRPRDALGEAAAAGALTALMVIAPLYTYEHHLVMLLLPLAAVGAALGTGRLPKWAWAPALLTYASLAWPLGWRRAMNNAVPDARYLLQESKFLGCLALIALCLWVVRRSPVDQKGSASIAE